MTVPYQGHAPDLLSQVDCKNLITSQLESLAEIKWGENSVLLMGDAAHRCPPSLQQGGALAFEDARVLQETYTPCVSTWLQAFKERRGPRVESIFKLSTQRMTLMSQEQLEKVHLFIAEKGAPNVSGFKTFMDKNP